MESINWTVELTKSFEKQKCKLTGKIRDILDRLLKEMELSGPVRSNWKSFGKLHGRIDDYHCHLKSGKPTYVVCWRITNKKSKTIEVYYVGTHENAPY